MNSESINLELHISFHETDLVNVLILPPAASGFADADSLTKNITVSKLSSTLQ
jgi:hypothetical protein